MFPLLPSNSDCFTQVVSLRPKLHVVCGKYICISGIGEERMKISQQRERDKGNVEDNNL